MRKHYKYLNGDFILEIKNPKLDNAQYLMMRLMEQMEKEEVKHNNSQDFIEEIGIKLGYYTGSNGTEYLFYISGHPVINNYDGESISQSAKMLPLLLSDKNEEELHYSSLAYIQVFESNIQKFVGVYYNIADAIAEINS